MDTKRRDRVGIKSRRKRCKIMLPISVNTGSIRGQTAMEGAHHLVEPGHESSKLCKGKCG